MRSKPEVDLSFISSAREEFRENERSSFSAEETWFMFEGARPRMRRGFWFGSELVRGLIFGLVRREVMVCIVS